MKKFLVLALAFVLALTLVACGGKSDPADGAASTADDTSTSSPVESPEAIAELTPSITPAAGWEKDEASVNLRYKNSEGALMEFSTDTMPADAATADEYVAFTQDKFKQSFADATFSATTKSQVGGMDAVEFGFTTVVSSMELHFRIVYICKDGSAYTITCSAPGAAFDGAQADFQSMIDSYTLQ